MSSESRVTPTAVAAKISRGVLELPLTFRAALLIEIPACGGAFGVDGAGMLIVAGVDEMFA